LDYCALSLFGGIHGRIVNCYLASVSVKNTLPLSSVYQISPDILCHLPEKSQSFTAGNNGASTSVPLSLGHALYFNGGSKLRREVSAMLRPHYLSEDRKASTEREAAWVSGTSSFFYKIHNFTPNFSFGVSILVPLSLSFLFSYS
jgi:hypothetical protein